MRSAAWAASALVVAAALTSLAFPPGPAAAAQAPQGGACQVTVTIPVALAPGGPADQQLSAEYCTPPGPHVSTVDILIPGATYDDLYWDWPVDPSVYSFAGRDLAAGRAILAVSRLGTGASSRPASSAVTAAVSAYTIHQAAAWARQLGYQKVNLIGHSAGSDIAALDAAAWPQDATAVVLTGDLNVSGADEAAAEADIWPAANDPQFSGPAFDGYLTTVDGTRSTLFYAPGADPAVIAYDEAHKDVVSATEFGTAIAVASLPPGPANPDDQVTAPVLLVVGQEDYLLCLGAGVPGCSNPAALWAYEAPYFSGAASLTVRTVPGTGHDLALSPSAGVSFAMINGWLSSRDH